MKPQAPIPQFDVIPSVLKSLNQWVLWRYELVKGRWTKVPYRADGRGKASSTNPNTWCTFQQAMDAYARLEVDGIGFVVTTRDDITGVDFDHIIDDTGVIKPEFQEIVDTLDSYTEWSPSGEGIRVFCRGRLPAGRRKNGPFEAYEHARFLTVTGRVYGQPKPVAERTAELAAFHAKYLATAPRPQRQHAEYRPGLTGSLGGGREGKPLPDHALVKEMLSSKSGTRLRMLWAGNWEACYSSQSEADMALASSLLWWSQGDLEQASRLFRESGMYRPKWDRADYQQRTFSAAMG